MARTISGGGGNHSTRIYTGHDRFHRAVQAEYERLCAQRDEYNKNYPVGALVQYWYDNKLYNSVFGFISKPFEIDRACESYGALNDPTDNIYGYVLPINIHGILNEYVEYWEKRFEITRLFGGIEKVTLEDYYAYARNNIRKTIKQQQEALRSTRKILKDYRHKQKILVNEMQYQAFLATEEIKKMVQKTT